MKFLDLEYDTFSLEINDLSVRIIKAVKSGRDFVVNSFNEIRIRPGIVEGGVIKNEEALSAVIKAACKKIKGKKINTKYVVASLPEEESFVQVIQMPKMSEDELRSAVVFEAENYIPMAIDKVYFDFQIIRPVIDGVDHLDVLIIAMPKKIVDSYVSCIKKSGLVPVVLEVESQAIARALIKNETSNYPIILADLNDRSPDFVIFSGTSLRFTSSAEFPPESNGLANKRSKKFRTLAVEMLVSQIEKYIDFYKEHASHEHIPTEGVVKKIILCGKESDLKGLPELVFERTGIDTEMGNPFINFPRNNEKNNQLPDALRFATALGLSLIKHD